MTNCYLGTRANQSKLKREPQIQCLSFFPEKKLRPSEVGLGGWGAGRLGGGGGGGLLQTIQLLILANIN